MSYFGGYTSDSDMSRGPGSASEAAAFDCVSDSSGEEVSARPGAFNRNGQSEDRPRLPVGAHIVFSGSDEEDSDAESSISSCDTWAASEGPSVLTGGLLIHEVSSTGASSSNFCPIPPVPAHAASEFVVGAHEAHQSLFQAEDTEPNVSSSGSQAPHADRKRKRGPKKKKLHSSLSRRRFNKLKTVLIKKCEEDPEHFDPDTEDLPEFVTSNPREARKLRERLTHLQGAALRVRAGEDKSCLLEARAKLGYGEYNSHGTLIKLKKKSGVAETAPSITDPSSE